MRDAATATDVGRGQSEPLAALVSVAVVCAAISVYTGVFGAVVPTIGSERSVAAPAAEAIWQDLSENNLFDGSQNATSALDRSTLPAGYHTAVRLTVVGENGSIVTVAEATFDESATVTSRPSPPDAETVERAVAIRRGPGEVRPGRLVVEVWDE